MSDDQYASPEVREAMDVLMSSGIDFEQTSQYQLKIASLNFYPRTGTIYRDGDKKALKERGLDALLDLISNLRRDRPPRRRGGPETLDLSPSS